MMGSLVGALSATSSLMEAGSVFSMFSLSWSRCPEPGSGLREGVLLLCSPVPEGGSSRDRGAESARPPPFSLGGEGATRTGLPSSRPPRRSLSARSRSYLSLSRRSCSVSGGMSATNLRLGPSLAGDGDLLAGLRWGE